MLLLGVVGRLPQSSERQSAEVYFAPSALTSIASGMFSATVTCLLQTDWIIVCEFTSDLIMLYFNVGTGYIELRETNSC